MSDLITKSDFTFNGSSIEVADEIIEKCNKYDSMIDKASKLVAIERGRAYAYAKVKLKTNVAIADRYDVDEKSIRNYIDIFDGRKFIESERVPNDTGVNKLVKTAKTGKAKAKVEAMDIDIDDFTDAEIITMSKMKPTEAKEYSEDAGETYAEIDGTESTSDAEDTVEVLSDDVIEMRKFLNELDKPDANDEPRTYTQIDMELKEGELYGHIKDKCDEIDKLKNFMSELVSDYETILTSHNIKFEMNEETGHIEEA